MAEGVHAEERVGRGTTTRELHNVGETKMNTLIRLERRTYQRAIWLRGRGCKNITTILLRIRDL